MEIAQHHHKKRDGSGYPDGLAGDDMPIASRRMAIADGRGHRFDPVSADAVVAIQPLIEAIARRYDDPGG